MTSEYAEHRIVEIIKRAARSVGAKATYEPCTEIANHGAISYDLRWRAKRCERLALFTLGAADLNLIWDIVMKVAPACTFLGACGVMAAVFLYGLAVCQKAVPLHVLQSVVVAELAKEGFMVRPRDNGVSITVPFDE